MSDQPEVSGGRPLANAIARFQGWLREKSNRLLGYPLNAQQVPAAAMTDEQLHGAIYRVGAELLNCVSTRVLMPAYSRKGIKGDPRFPHGLPTTVRDHVLMFTSDDSFGLSVIGLGKHATAAALGPIRTIAETLALTKWLMESPSDADRQGRAYRLTLSALDQRRRDARMLRKACPSDAQALKMADWLADSADTMERSLQSMANQDHVAVAGKPPSASMLAALHLSGADGYMFYSLTSAAGVHAGAHRAALFYSKPGSKAGTAILDFDFKGMHAQRAYWIAVSIELHLKTLPSGGTDTRLASVGASHRGVRPEAGSVGCGGETTIR